MIALLLGLVYSLINMPDTQETQSLKQLTEPNSDAARLALDYLAQVTRAPLDGYLRSTCGVRDHDTREDIAQSVFARVWVRRESLHFTHLGAWHAFVRRSAYHAYVDRLRDLKRLPVAADYDLQEIPAGERSLVEAALIAGETGWLSTLADTALLGLTSASPRDHDRQLLAAQLFYLDGEPWHRVRRLVGTPAPSREELDGWLTDPGVVRHLAFHALHLEGEELLAALLTDARAETGWSESERQVLRWRYVNALSAEQITARADCPLNPVQIAPVLTSAGNSLPFRGIMQQVVAALQRSGAAQTGSVAQAGLWQRLAFEYRYRDDLALGDIHERTQPAAEVVGSKLTPGMLNMWLSGGRLLRRVAILARAQLGDEAEGEML